MSNLENMTVEEQCINTIRTLCIDAVQAANSGHPGTPMAMSPLAYLLFSKVMKHNPNNPDWFNRDRFVLSGGHASTLLYSALHVAGYDISLEDVKNFRQWGSKTPGHPEVELPGVETTTGPLGQGITNSVGMAMAEKHLAAVFNKNGKDIIDHYTYALCGDGDMMEGISHEAASIAGHFGLGKLVWFYDDNHITIEGKTELTFTDDTAKRFEAYGWHVINVGEKANDIAALEQAINDAKAVTDKPSLVIIRSHIGFGSPNLVDTSEVHGAPLGEEEVKLTKKALGWPEDEKFLVPEAVKAVTGEIKRAGNETEAKWNDLYASYKADNPGLAAQLESAISGELPEGWDADIPTYTVEDGAAATRNVSGKVLNAISTKVPFLAGGSADLNPSTKTFLNNSGYFSKDNPANTNMPWGVREFGMSAAASGMALHGGIRPFVSTFFVFTDYLRPALRLAALMELPVVYVMTHDSIGVGEDGPTHQPIEQMASCRLMPNVTVIRPGDPNETAWAWKAAMLNKTGPTMLLLTRQNIAVIDQTKYGTADGVLKGAYVVSKEKGDAADMILIGTGSELELVMQAQEKLAVDGIDARVVSMPSWELFEKQDADYKESVLPKAVTKRLAVEAGSPFGWEKYVGSGGDTITIDRYGSSGPYKVVFPKFGFSVENVVEKAKAL